MFERQALNGMFRISPGGIVEIISGGQETIGGVVRVVVGLIVIYYLTRPHVKVFFGK